MNPDRVITISNLTFRLSSVDGVLLEDNGMNMFSKVYLRGRAVNISKSEARRIIRMLKELE